MEHDFWHRKWQTGDTAFHESQANPLLVAYVDQLQLAPGSRIFLPLCGKTRDIAWLLAQGYRVAGAELSALAVTELFNELGITPDITPANSLTRYSANGIDIFTGDIFDLTAGQLGAVAAIYDRAALVALPAAMRARYARHLLQACHNVPQLLITYEYDQSQADGPPFSVTADEVQQLYGNACRLTAIERRKVAGGLRGKVPATETLWQLQPLPS